MAKPLPLPVWDRQAGKLITEWMDDHPTTYESEPQRSIRQWIKSQPLYDWLIAAYQNTHHSTREIEPFVRKYKIDMSEFEPVQYHSFAEFFDRRFRPGARKFPSAPGEMGAFAEARYFAWDRLSADQQFPVKGYSLNAELILGNAQRARPFMGGPVLLARLAPVDYHRAHYFDDGRTLDHDRLGRRLWTVNPHALHNKHSRDAQLRASCVCGDRSAVGGANCPGSSPRFAVSSRRREVGLPLRWLGHRRVRRTRAVATIRRSADAHARRGRDTRAARRNYRGVIVRNSLFKAK